MHDRVLELEIWQAPHWQSEAAHGHASLPLQEGGRVWQVDVVVVVSQHWPGVPGLPLGHLPASSGR